MGPPSDPVTVFDVVRPAWRRLRIGSTVAPLHLRGFTVLRALQSPGWSHLSKVPCFGQPQLASAYNMVAKNWWRYRLQHLDVKMLDVGQCQLRMANLRAEMILQSVRNLGYFELGNSAKDLDSWRALALPNVSPSGITEPCETLAILRQLPSPSCEQVLASWCWDPVTMSGIEHYKDNFSTTSSFWGVDCLGDNLKFSTRFLYLTDNQWTPLYDASSRFGCCFLTVAGASW